MQKELEKDLDKIENLDREDYMKLYNFLGNVMWQECNIPTVGDYADILTGTPKNKENSLRKLEQITSFTGNTDSIKSSIEKTEMFCTNEDIDKYMNEVIASNISDISDAGYFYKKLISSCDNIKIETKIKDCGSPGEEIFIKDITRELFDYKIKNQWCIELGKYCISWEELKKDLKNIKSDIIHINTPLTCTLSSDHRTLCPKCAGAFYRAKNRYFVPKNFGLFSTLMITEHATQASLDSMNKGQSSNINKILEESIPKKGYTWEEIIEYIQTRCKKIGNVGVMSKFYEIAFISRFYKNRKSLYEPVSLQMSFLYQNDPLGAFIYRPTKENFKKLVSSNAINATSIKSRVMFDSYI